MRIYNQKWWKKMFGKEHHEKPIDSLSDIEAVGEFLLGVNKDRAKLLQQLEELEELEKERKVGTSGVIQINLEAQALVLDKLLQTYGDFQNDVDINGLRIKMLARQFLKEADKAGLKDLVREKKQNQKWKDWW